MLSEGTPCSSQHAVDLFNIPPEKFVEVGRQIEI
jgi:hypothetical protein